MEKNKELLIAKAENFYNGEPYYGDPIMKILEGLDSAKALHRAGSNAHNIAELLAHIIGWEEYSIKQFKGIKEFQMGQDLSFDWRRIDKNENKLWGSLLRKLEMVHKELIGLLNDEKYDVEKKQELLDNMMQHDIYHFGQIAILKKIIG